MIDIIGKITGDVLTKDGYYLTKIAVKRKSENIDILPLVIPFTAVGSDLINSDNLVFVHGKVKSTNKDRHLFVFVEVVSISLYDDLSSDTINNANLEGFVCKAPINRHTPLGRNITELLIAVNTPTTSSYIPCILWNNKNADSLKVGSKVKVNGRLQSRDYTKLNIVHTTYELSVSDINICL